jgi:lambda family phage minor tail protein L
MALQYSIGMEVQKLAPSAIIDLFELDATELYDSNNQAGELVRFHAGTNGLEQILVWQGLEYTPFPVEFTGFEANTKGTIPRPQVKIANIGGAISSLLYAFDNLIGAKVTRKRTFARFLDGVNFPSGQNPTADPNAAFPDEVFYISRKVLENHIYVELELSPSWDLHGIKLPRRICAQNVCPWKYKGMECGYYRVPSFVGLALSYTASLATGVTITSTAHPLVVGNAVHLNFNDPILNGVYSIKSTTVNNFTIYVEGLGVSGSGVVDVTNNYSLSDTPIYSNVETLDRCSRRLSSCKIRYGGDTVLPYGGFPGVGWIR